MTLPNTLVVSGTPMYANNKLRNIALGIGAGVSVLVGVYTESKVDEINNNPYFQPKAIYHMPHIDTEVPRGGIRHITYDRYANVTTPPLASGVRMISDPKIDSLELVRNRDRRDIINFVIDRENNVELVIIE